MCEDTGVAGTKVLAGLAQAGLPEAVAGADRLFFHAGLYSNFARDPAMVEALETALARPGFERLEVVSLDPVARPAYWNEFCGVLRRNMTETALQREFSVSGTFLDALASRHPLAVRLYLTSALPLAPILLVGDTIYAGHYLHSPAAAPQGYWLAIQADMADLLDRAESGANPDALDPETTGAYRFVCECVAARNASRRLA